MREYNLPKPIIDKKEEHLAEEMESKYEKLLTPSLISKVGSKASTLIPAKMKEIGVNITDSITEKEFLIHGLKRINEGFMDLEQEVANFTLREDDIIKIVNKYTKKNKIVSLNEICLVRSYEIEVAISRMKSRNKWYSSIEGGVTGFFGFIGILPSLVTSVFLYYRAIQVIAMFYGYDVRNDPDELIIASQVFINSFDPRNASNTGLAESIGKIMLVSKTVKVGQVAGKGWSAMAQNGSVELLLTQMRALAHQSAKKALDKAGKKSIENVVFKEIFEQIGKKLTLKSIQRAVPFISVLIGAFFDRGQMKQVLEFSDIYYHNRFLLEKKSRIDELIQRTDSVSEEEK